MTKKEADKLWDELKDLPIDMFSLPNQRVQNHAVRKGGTSDSVILGLRSAAVLPSLEAALGAQKQYRNKVSYAMKAEGENITEVFPKYDMEESEGGYVTVRRHVPTTDKSEFQDYVAVVEPVVVEEAVETAKSAVVMESVKSVKSVKPTREQSPRARAKARRSSRND